MHVHCTLFKNTKITAVIGGKTADKVDNINRILMTGTYILQEILKSFKGIFIAENYIMRIFIIYTFHRKLLRLLNQE
jgi:hypothetical protein